LRCHRREARLHTRAATCAAAAVRRSHEGSSRCLYASCTLFSPYPSPLFSVPLPPNPSTEQAFVPSCRQRWAHHFPFCLCWCWRWCWHFMSTPRPRWRCQQARPRPSACPRRTGTAPSARPATRRASSATAPKRPTAFRAPQTTSSLAPSACAPPTTTTRDPAAAPASSLARPAPARPRSA